MMNREDVDDELERIEELQKGMEEDQEMNQDQDEDEDSQDLYEHFRFVSDKGQTILRLDKFLVDRMQNTARNRIQNAAKAGNILVNNIAVKPNYRVKPFDVVTIVLPNPPRETELLPEKIDLNIVYEDSDVLVINKTPGMVVHPGFGNFTGTLVNALMYYLGGKPYLVHRIDKDTSGLLLVAKNEMAQTYLAKQFFDHSIERKYYALVWGDFKEEEGTVEGHVGRSVRDRKIMTVYPQGEQGKYAITHYKVKERFGYVTLVECVLETGRTHQIRCHMKYIKHPLFNDVSYGGNQILKGTTFTKYKQFIQNCFNILPRQALHAATLGFIHPLTHKPIRLESPLPEDMENVLGKWRIYSKSREYQPEEESFSSDEKTLRARLLNENK